MYCSAWPVLFIKTLKLTFAQLTMLDHVNEHEATLINNTKSASWLVEGKQS